MINIIEADYHDPRHADDLLLLLDLYARDPMGGGKPLAQAVRQNLVPRLAELPAAFSLLAYHAETPVALANCLLSFSTFAARPVINIHDFMVRGTFRGRGISQLLLDRIERKARGMDCCKITLEVLSNNAAAIAAYRKHGFCAYQLTPQAGIAQFWHKSLPQENDA